MFPSPRPSARVYEGITPRRGRKKKQTVPATSRTMHITNSAVVVLIIGFLLDCIRVVPGWFKEQMGDDITFEVCCQVMG